MTLKVGVTGGIGSGKSIVCRIFNLLGVPVYNADLAARSIMENDLQIRSRMIDAFGAETYTFSGKLNRSYLSRVVFNDANQLKKLNSIVHPAVFRDAEKWFSEQTFPYAIKEAALIFETGGEKDLDLVITVTAPVKLRLKRVHQRDGISYSEILDRMKNQLPETEKVKRSDIIIRNNGRGSLVEQVWRAHQKILHAYVPLIK